MTTYLQRYQDGDYEAVWMELSALGSDIRTNERLLRDAEAVAMATMQRVRQNTIALMEQLRRSGYIFTSFRNKYHPPSKNIRAYIQEIERKVGSMPLSVVAFMSIVGSIDLTGHFPTSDEYGHAWEQAVLPDPLVFQYPPSFFRWSFQEWSNNVIDFGIEDVGDFVLEFAPDEYHKSNISGGSPYSIKLPNNSIDALVEDEWHHTTFIAYLRECFRWGGFPGLSRASAPPREDINRLTKPLVLF
jgi:hypothetical protein